MGVVMLAFSLMFTLCGARQEEKGFIVDVPSSPLPAQWSAQTRSSSQSLERNEVDGWTVQTYKGNRGMERVERAIDPYNPNNHVLKAFCNLNPAREEKGEIICSLYPVGGQMIPLIGNFQGATIKAKVFVPTGGLGSPDAPSGFQLILKSRPGYKNYYSYWENVPEERRWFGVSATPPVGGWVDAGFDASRVLMVGVKMGLSSDATREFRGEILIDDFEVTGPDGKTIAKWDFEPKG